MLPKKKGLNTQTEPIPKDVLLLSTVSKSMGLTLNVEDRKKKFQMIIITMG